MDRIRQILSDGIFWLKYAKWLPDQGRRETWSECVERSELMHLMRHDYPKHESIKEAFAAVEAKTVMPSARSLQFAGKTIERNPARIYNCSFRSVKHPRAFDEIFFLALGGTGVGWSVQSFHVSCLPEIRKPSGSQRWLVADSIEGWASAVRQLMQAYFYGEVEPLFDFSDIRPKGAPLLTSGGVAPGPEKLEWTLNAIRRFLCYAKGRRLSSLETHDILCLLMDCVTDGGSRRSAAISLFDLDDEQMLISKKGSWYEDAPWRCRANNSVVLHRSKLRKRDFVQVWQRIRESGSGDPGIFFTNDSSMGCNPCQPGWATVLTPQGVRVFDQIDVGSTIWSGKRWTKVTRKVYTGVKPVNVYITDGGRSFIGTANHKVVEKGVKVEVDLAWWIDACPFPEDMVDLYSKESAVPEKSGIKHRVYAGNHPVYDITVEAEEHTYWTGGLLVSNCGEASLRNQTCCNLTTFSWSPDPEEAIYRAKMAARIGVLQSDFTNFHYLNPQWQERVERDQLIGVSITGLADFGTPSAELLRACAEAVQVEAGNPNRGPARLTCMKPEGTLSLLLGTSPGIHASLFPFALRRVTLRKSEALYKWLLENNPEAVEDSSYNEQEAFWLIPLQSKASVTGGEESWRDLLERVLLVQRAWIIPGHRRGANTHSISLTFSIEDEDWDPLREEIWKHRDQLNGITVFPKSKHTYKQLPFEQVAEAEFERREKELKEIPFSAVKEERDQTERQQEAACAGGQCLLT
jgi:hypothetical protein